MDVSTLRYIYIRGLFENLSFSGLAHCRHMKTIRTHLVCLVNRRVVSPSEEGLTEELWTDLRSEMEVSTHFLLYYVSLMILALLAG